MNRRIENAEIAAFLEEAKSLISTGRYDFVPRCKNMQSLAEHGLTISDVRDEILSLTTGDYYSGPKRDHDANRPGDVWEFKRNVDGDIFYVKVKISEDNRGKVLKCLSFHEDEFS